MRFTTKKPGKIRLLLKPEYFNLSPAVDHIDCRKSRLLRSVFSTAGRRRRYTIGRAGFLGMTGGLSAAGNFRSFEASLRCKVLRAGGAALSQPSPACQNKVTPGLGICTRYVFPLELWSSRHLSSSFLIITSPTSTAPRSGKSDLSPPGFHRRISR